MGAELRKTFYEPEEMIEQVFEENQTIKRNGKEQNIQDYVQSFKDDCEIYTLIEKYGAVEKIPMDTQVIEGDLSGIKNLRDLKEQEIKAANLWNSLPLEVRKEFNNDRYLFAKEGLNWAKKKNAEILAKQQQEQATQRENSNAE